MEELFFEQLLYASIQVEGHLNSMFGLLFFLIGRSRAYGVVVENERHSLGLRSSHSNSTHTTLRGLIQNTLQQSIATLGQDDTFLLVGQHLNRLILFQIMETESYEKFVKRGRE